MLYTDIETHQRNQHRKRINIVSIKQVNEKSIYYTPRTISNPDDIAKLFSTFIEDSDRKQFIVCCLDTKNQPTDISIVSTGCLNSAIVHPREVFKIALLSNASSIIIGHNHPSGNPEPSHEDKDTTNRLIEVGKIHGIKVLDHIIIGYNNGYLSFKECGYI